MKKKKRYWEITGWNSTTMIFEKRVKCSYFSEKRMKELLMALTAKHGLTDDEIISSYAHSNTKIAIPSLLEVQVYNKPYSMSCGINPFFTVQIKTDDE